MNPPPQAQSPFTISTLPGGEQSITCHRCGTVSRDPGAVREHWCAKCKTFHEKEAPLCATLEQAAGELHEEAAKDVITQAEMMARTQRHPGQSLHRGREVEIEGVRHYLALQQVSEGGDSMIVLS